jgi:hypothetical protein
MPAPPRPLATRRSRAFVITPGVVVAAILTLLVGGFVAWLGFEFVNFARTPELRITEPAGNVSAHTEPTITVRGVTAPNAVVTFSELPENPTVTADASGVFEVTVQLRPGSNVMRVVARDPVTGRDSAVEERTIMRIPEPSPTPQAEVALGEPAAGATVTGTLTLSGTAGPNQAVEVTATVTDAPTPTFEVTTASGAPVELTIEPPAAPEPLSLAADASGSFAGTLELPAGAWELTVTPDGGEPITRSITVEPAAGVRATLEIDGGESYLVAEEDGTVVDDISGNIAPDGEVIELEGDESLRIRVGNAGAVRITINGISIGLMGDDAQVVEWRVTRAGG